MTPEKSVDLTALEDRLAADLRPVRSFHPDRACALVVALTFGLGLGILWPLLGLRQDATLLGPLWLWGPSALSALIGGGLISLALRRVIPGNLPSLAAMVTAVAVALPVCVWLYSAVYARSPQHVPPEETVRLSLICVGMEVCLGLPALLFLLWLARRGVAVRPIPTAIVGALGVALVCDAVWRLICKYSHPTHVAVSHGLGMITVVLIGVGLVYLWDRGAIARSAETCRAK